MRSTQEKFTAALEALVVSAGFELVNDRRFSNTGTFRIEAEDSFAAVLSMSYSFQDGYTSFQDVTPPIADRQSGTSFPAVKPDQLDARVLNAVRTHLHAVRAEQRPGLTQAMAKQRTRTIKSRA